MARAILKLMAIFAVSVILMMLQKPLFMLVYHSSMNVDGSFVAAILDVIWHGLPMDCSVAGYLTVIPAILIIASLCTGNRVVTKIETVYYAVVSLSLATITSLDLILYEPWGFRLDVTPFFYLASSPTASLASATPGLIIGGTATWAAIVLTVFAAYRFTASKLTVSPITTKKRRTTAVVVMTLLTGMLFIPIRGGLTVSTMNLSSAYFSQNQRLNHAAINPAFSLLYSATHQTDFGSQFRYFDEAEAERIMNALTSSRSSDVADSALLSTPRPDIYLVILESFSSHLLPIQGGEPIAVYLDSIAREGILFNRFYASSFRTDRAIPAILSGFPGQPTTSVMKYVDKAGNLPAWPRELKKNGYALSYYYGGDVNFTNMLAYLVNQGFENIIRDTDFPLSLRTSKWGVHDEYVFERALNDITASDATSTPRLRVIQTSSSHEPFKVPYSNQRLRDNERANAFAYADSCLGAFVNRLKASPKWSRSLVIIVPDHFGVYPRNVADGEGRHHIPLVLTGGALKSYPAINHTVGSQTDIAATILGALGIGHTEFEFSHDLFDPDASHHAFFSDKNAIGMIDSCNSVYYNIEAERPVYTSGNATDSLTTAAKAMLQTIYTRLSTL